jgi:hypothetical protein
MDGLNRLFYAAKKNATASCSADEVVEFPLEQAVSNGWGD